MLLAEQDAAQAEPADEVRQQCAMDVAHPHDEVERARGQRAVGVVVEIRAEPLDAKAALGGGLPAALERDGGNIERGDVEAVLREIEGIAPRAACDVERAPALEMR